MELEMNKPNADEPERAAAPTAALPTRHRFIVSIFGDITRTGSWPARRRLAPVAVFGDIDLDLRQAALPAADVAITAVAPFGNIDVQVPGGVEVDVSGFTLFGSKTYTQLADPAARGAAKDELSAEVVKAYGGDVTRVYFTEFVMQ